MFNNIGGKIKAVASICARVGIILSCLIGFIFLFFDALIGILIAGIGSLCSWISSFLLYGFGELIYTHHQILEILRTQEEDTTIILRLLKKQANTDISSPKENQ